MGAPSAAGPPNPLARRHNRSDQGRRKGCALYEPLQWPVKTWEFQNHHFDSIIGNDFRFRDDDIVIAT